MKKQKIKTEQIPPQSAVKDYVSQLRDENAKRQATMNELFERIDRAFDKGEKGKKD